MKKQTVVAVGLVLLIPLVTMLGGFLFSVINPEIAAGHANYARNYQLLSLLRNMLFFGAGVVVVLLWVLACFLVIRSKERSLWWLLCAALGPIGFAILITLKDRVPSETDWHVRFVNSLNSFVRVGYGFVLFVVMGELAYRAMVVMRNLMILYESASTGMSTAQIIDQQNASSGMWAFGEGIEVIYLTVLFFLLWPIVFNLVGRVVTTVSSATAQ